MVSQAPNVQLNATVPAQDSSSSINTTARAEVTVNPLHTTIAHNSNISPTALMSGSNNMGQHHGNSFRMSANDVPEQLVLRGSSDEDVPAILAQSRTFICSVYHVLRKCTPGDMAAYLHRARPGGIGHRRYLKGYDCGPNSIVRNNEERSWAPRRFSWHRAT